MTSPLVSVVLNSYNAKERLIYSLISYNQQTYPKEDFDVVLVDDGSTDGTVHIVDKLKLNFSLKYIKLPNNRGRAAARNRGIDAASGKIIIFSDSDMIAEKDFIRKHVAHHERDRDIFVCGSFWNRIFTLAYRTHDKALKKRILHACRRYTIMRKRLNRKRLIRKGQIRIIPLRKIKKGQFLKFVTKQPWARSFEMPIKRFGLHLDGFRFPWIYFIVMNVSVRKEHLDRVGYFDENFRGWGGEDIDMGYRLYHAGVKAIVDPTIINIHQEHPRLFHKQFKEKERNKHYLVNKHLQLDILMRYAIPFMNTFHKNQLLFDIEQADYDHLVSDSFRQSCLNLLILFYRLKSSQGYPYVKEIAHIREALNSDLSRLRDIPKYQSLVRFLEMMTRNTYPYIHNH